jgi:hypothetical protein
MPIVPNVIERLVFKLKLAPAPILDFLGAQAFRVFAAAHRLGVFDALAGGPATAAQVAHRIQADERGTTLLLQALEAVGYVKQKNGSYAVTAMTARWLPVLGVGIPWFETMADRFSDL